MLLMTGTKWFHTLHCKRIRIRIRNRSFSKCTGNTLIIWSHTSIHTYKYTYILHAMYSNILMRTPVSCAARNPTAKSRGSREPRDQACMLIVFPRNRTDNSAEMLPRCLFNLRAIGKKCNARLSQPRDSTTSLGGQPPDQQKKAKRTSCGDVC